MRVPHRVDTEVQEEGPVRRGQEGDRGDTQHAGREDGRRREGGGQRLPGPHTHLPQDRAEAQREQRGGEAEGQERNHPARAAPRVEEADGQGPDAMGEGLLREHRRP